MKLQVFLYNKFGYAQRIADALAEKFTCKCDQIPPAYQCNEERLIFIVYEKYGSLDKKLVAYMKEMDKKKVQNIAYIEISNTGNEALDQMSEIVKANGVGISGTYGVAIKRGLFSKGELTDEQFQDVMKFADEQGKANFEFLRRQG